MGLPLDLVLQLDGDHDHFMERLEGREICRSCAAMYNKFSNPPKVDGVCDLCGGRVRQRSDDNEKTISKRMRHYDQHAGSLLHYYELHGKLRQVPAEEADNQVFQALCNVINAHPSAVIEPGPDAKPAKTGVESKQKRATGGNKQGRVKVAAKKKSGTGKKAMAGKKAATGKKTATGKKAATVKKAVTGKKTVAGKKAASGKRPESVKKRPATKKKPVIKKKPYPE